MNDVDTLPVKPEQIQKTRRYKSLKKLDDYYHSTQYKGKPDFWTGDKNGEIVPLRERAPCIIYPLPKAVVNQATRFTLGEGRFPRIRFEAVEVQDGTGLSKEEAEALTSYVEGIIDQVGLRANMRTLMRRGTSSGTSVPILNLRQGKFCIDMPHAHDTWPVFENNVVGDVERLTICYEFDKLIPQNNEVKYERYYYRRDITDEEYIVYYDVKVENGKPPRWSIDENETIQHKLGFCPVGWIRNLADPYSSDIDGVSLYDGLLDEFDSLNFALSQRHRGIVFHGVPQPWETGVKDDDGPEAMGRTAMAQDNTSDPFHVSGTSAARKAAPDQVWRYRSADTEVGLLETTGRAFDAATKHVNDIRERLLEAMDIVLLDQMKVTGSGDISAKALALMYAPLLALVDELRDCWWSCGIKQIVSMALRIVAATGGKGILLPESEKVAKILQRFLVDLDDKKIWLCPKMVPNWGPYFSPLNSEVMEAVTTVVTAKNGGVISATTATSWIKDYFGIEDVPAELALIEKEKPNEPEQPLQPKPGEPAKPRPQKPKEE
jgi:hypothetical protein